MKNLFCLFVLLSFISFNINAQTVAERSIAQATEIADANGDDKVEVLTSFKATKAQKKVINKVKKYVTPRVLNRKANVAALDGKTVKVQMKLDAQGAIAYLIVVDGISPKLDEKVVALVREYNEKKPFANSDLVRPAVVQMEIPVAGKRNYGSWN